VHQSLLEQRLLATRSAALLSAFTLENDNRPAANAPAIDGSSSNVRATRRYSRAACGDTEHDQDNQCAHDFSPTPTQPWRRSNSATSRNHSHVEAANPAANEQIRASNPANDLSTADSATAALTETVPSNRTYVRD
jgi:hypothetical protein